MFSVIKVLIIIIILNPTLKNVVAITSSELYIKAKLTETTNTLINAYARRAATGDQNKNYYENKWQEVWSETLAVTQLHTINVYNQMFLIDDKNVLSVVLNPDSIDKIQIVNELNLASSQDSIKFTKAFSWNESSFLLVCQTYACTHYQGSDLSKLRYGQVIVHNNLLPVDACFFMHKGQLYLIITYNANGHSEGNVSPSKIHQWTGERMDFTGEIITPAVRTLAIFHDDEESTILIFALQNNFQALDQHFSCILYEFTDRKNSEQISFLTNEYPILSIIPYNNNGEEYTLLVSDASSSGIFWWTGYDLQKWINIPEINASSIVKIIKINNDILLLVCNSFVLYVYKLFNDNYVKLNELNLKSGQRVIDMSVWENDNSLMLLLTKLNFNDKYEIELKRLPFRQLESENMKSHEVWACLQELQNLLNLRMAAVENLRNSWSNILPLSKIIAFDIPMRLFKFYLNGGKASLLEFDNRENLIVSDPANLQNELTKFQTNVEIILALSKNIVFNNKIPSFSNHLVINGNAHFSKLFINNLNINYLNDENIEMDRILISEVDQSFSLPLVGNNILINNLEIPSLCGLNANNWLQVNNNKEKIEISNINFNDSWIHNDTISIKNDLTLKEVNVKNINRVFIKSFLNNLFMLGKNQVIIGNITYRGVVQIVRLEASEVNGVSTSKLLTKNTNQTLEDIFIETLGVQELHVKKINGVEVDKAAKMSQKNIIKGKVTISNLVIIEELTLKGSTNLPFTKPIQMYDEILINGNIFVKNLNLDSKTILTFGNDEFKAHNIYEIQEKSWKKSKSQVIESPIIFKNGISVDELDCQYLNGLSEQDFIYKNDEEIKNIENVTFNDFHFDKVINQSTGISTNFYEESLNALTFLKVVHISHLSVDNIFTEKYNGVPIEIITNTKDNPTYFERSEFETLYVKRQMNVNELQIHRLNRRNVNPFKNALRSNQNLQIDTLRITSIEAKNVKVDKLNGKILEEALFALENLDFQDDKILFTIDGELEVENNLQVNKINNEYTKDYLNLFRNHNLVNIIKTDNIENLYITENLNISSLNGFDINDIFAKALSKTNKQYLANTIAFNDAHIPYLTVSKINNKSTAHLMYIDEPITFYGNISFSHLILRGNIITKTLNNKKISELQKELQTMPIKNVTSLHVLGDMFWKNSSINLHSVSYLLNNAVTKNENQLINNSVTFENSVIIDSLHFEKLKNSTVYQKLDKIFSDAVIDDSKETSIFIKGPKIFRKGLVTGNLEVANNIDIQYINGVDIQELSSQIFQKYKNDTISAQITFLGDVEVLQLVTNKKIHGIPLYELATIHKKMPKYLYFDSLIVRNNVTLRTLDGVDFNDFKRNRLTINADYEIFNDVEINNSVSVLNESFVSLINGIKPTDVITNVVTRTPTVIYGKKTFVSKLFVDGDIETDLFNGFDIDKLHSDCFLGEENLIIRGDLTFEDDVEISGNIDISGCMNGLEFQPTYQISTLQNKLVASVLSNKIPSIQDVFQNSAKYPYNRSTDQSLYLEQESSLNIQLPEIYAVKNMQIENITRLDLYATGDALFCGLQDDCLCRKQYIVEMTPAGNYTIHQKNTSDVTFSFYQKSKLLNGFFGIEVVSNYVSNSESCSRESTELETSKIFWMRYNNRIGKEVKKLADEVDGFISDAQIFILNDKVYLVLAIFYDKTVKSHAIESPVFEFNLKNDEIKLIQTIPTDGAKIINIFIIDNVGVYLLLGCVKGKSESLLLRFDFKTGKFQNIRSFATGGSRHIASISRHKKNFVILNNPDTEALQIYVYNYFYDNFYDYQNLYFKSKITSLNVFYSGDFGKSEAFVITTTRDGSFYVYEYMFYGQFQLKIQHWIEDIKTLSPFRHINQNYLLACWKSNSTVLKFIK